jgi:indole-3-glycerol phosphate synthase
MTQSFLETIVKHKQGEVAAARRNISQTALEKAIPRDRPRLSLIQAMHHRDRVNIIAEIKRASPSKGVLCESLDAAETARVYENAGAAAISVLTDSRYFKGSPDDLRQVKEVTTIPVLRKDFIISEYQVLESAAMGADAILLIVRILTLNQLTRYLDLCRELNLEALVEVHSLEDVEKTLKTDARLIGINNRDLSTFETNISKAIHMGKMLAEHQIPVVASGIHNRDDIAKNCQAGMRNFLIGESLVRAQNPGRQLRAYVSEFDCLQARQ